MRLFLMLLGVAQVLDAGYITWEVMQVPLEFGEDVQIRCRYHNDLSCIDPIIWTWNIGTDNFDLIMNNGTLTEKYKNQTKYSEIRSSCSQYSTMKISHFNEKDYNQLYTCRIGNIDNNFGKYSNGEINFENISYKYNPMEDTIVTELQLQNEQIVYKVEIGEIYPLPECKAHLADIDITNTLDVQQKKTGLFYHVAITSTIYNKTLAAVGNLCIICNGTGFVWYLTKQLNPYCTGTPLADRSGCVACGVGIFVIAAMDVYCILYGCVILIGILHFFLYDKDNKPSQQIKPQPSFKYYRSYVTIAMLGTLGLITAARGDFKDVSGKSSHQEHIMEIFSFTSIAILDICGVVVSIITVLAIRKSTQRKMEKLLYIMATIVFLEYAIILDSFLINGWKFEFVFNLDMSAVSHLVYLIPGNLITFLLYSAQKQCSMRILNQLSDEKQNTATDQIEDEKARLV